MQSRLRYHYIYSSGPSIGTSLPLPPTESNSFVFAHVSAENYWFVLLLHLDRRNTLKDSSALAAFPNVLSTMLTSGSILQRAPQHLWQISIYMQEIRLINRLIQQNTSLFVFSFSLLNSVLLPLRWACTVKNCIDILACNTFIFECACVCNIFSTAEVSAVMLIHANENYHNIYTTEL